MHATKETECSGWTPSISSSYVKLGNEGTDKTCRINCTAYANKMQASGCCLFSSGSPVECYWVNSEYVITGGSATSKAVLCSKGNNEYMFSK